MRTIINTIVAAILAASFTFPASAEMGEAATPLMDALFTEQAAKASVAKAATQKSKLNGTLAEKGEALSEAKAALAEARLALSHLQAVDADLLKDSALEAAEKAVSNAEGEVTLAKHNYSEAENEVDLAATALEAAQKELEEAQAAVQAALVAHRTVQAVMAAVRDGAEAAMRAEYAEAASEELKAKLDQERVGIVLPRRSPLQGH